MQKGEPSYYEFEPHFYPKIWGGNHLKEFLNKPVPEGVTIGESWEISGVEGYESKVISKVDFGKSLPELIDIYKEKLVGESVYKKYGNKFPLLIKFLSTKEPLSIQVHPDDNLAKKRHNSLGKTECWYILENNDDSFIQLGFKEKIEKEKYVEFQSKNSVDKLLKHYKPEKEDLFFVPAGDIHSIGSDLLLVEVQQSSDVTYRIYDFNRKDENGKYRELHTSHSIDAINYNISNQNKHLVQYDKSLSSVNICSEEYFKINKHSFTSAPELNWKSRDSFTVLIVIEGEIEVDSDFGVQKLGKGKTSLYPALFDGVKIKYKTHNTKILEVFV